LLQAEEETEPEDFIRTGSRKKTEEICNLKKKQKKKQLTNLTGPALKPDWIPIRSQRENLEKCMTIP
jgi:hypothetical protein